MTPKYTALALCLGFAQMMSAERLRDADRDRERPNWTQRRYLVAHMRIAAADRLIEQPDEIAAYVGARFNTLRLYDAEDAWLRMPIIIFDEQQRLEPLNGRGIALFEAENLVGDLLS